MVDYTRSTSTPTGVQHPRCEGSDGLRRVSRAVEVLIAPTGRSTSHGRSRRARRRCCAESPDQARETRTLDSNRRGSRRSGEEEARGRSSNNRRRRANPRPNGVRRDWQNDQAAWAATFLMTGVAPALASRPRASSAGRRQPAEEQRQTGRTRRWCRAPTRRPARRQAYTATRQALKEVERTSSGAAGRRTTTRIGSRSTCTGQSPTQVAARAALRQRHQEGGGEERKKTWRDRLLEKSSSTYPNTPISPAACSAGPTSPRRVELRVEQRSTPRPKGEAAPAATPEEG